MIIKAMAITRCPYCHAIIDENDKYCNNCGTQLLFPEDEDVDEEIPGEKILDADTEDKDYTVEEPGDETRPAGARDLEKDIEEELEEETEELALGELVEEEPGEEDEDEAGDEADDVPEEVILVDEIEAAEAAGAGEPEKSEDSGAKKEGTAEILEATTEETAAGEEEKIELPAKDAEPDIEYITEDHDLAGAEASAEAEPPPATFDTGELEGIGKTVELSKVKIDEFLEVLAEKIAEPPAPPKEARAPTGTLPPWASTMKGAPVFPDEGGAVEAGEEGLEDTAPTVGDEEIEIFPRRRDSDSTIGLPERVGQAPLPFEADQAEAEEEEAILPPAGPSRPAREALRPVREPDRREPERRPFEAFEEAEEAEPRPPFSFSVFFKSKAFDVLFVGLFWLVALWLAANSLGATLFDILGSMSGPMLLLYAVFVFIYFFLFKFFLGETLGDRLFRERE
jgi:hypothetical protein